MAASSSSKSASVAELRRMFSNLDASVIESVLASNNGQVDITIDHLLTMSIDTENQQNNQQAIPTTPLRQLPAVPNIYEDDPPPYPGHETTASNRPKPMQTSSQHSSATVSSYSQHASSHVNESNVSHQQDLQVRKWKTSYGQNRVCYIGDLPNDFLQVKFLTKPEIDAQAKNCASSGDNSNGSKYLDNEYLTKLFQNDEFLSELRHNKDFLTALHSDQSTRSTPSSNQQRRSSNLISTKPLPLPTPPTVEIPKTPKVRAKMLQNVLTQIEQGQTIRTSMVPEDLITQNEEYSYGKDDTNPMPLPPAPYINEFDPLRQESNEEFTTRLKHMGKNSMEKFNQLARRFSTRKDSSNITTKYSKQPTISSTIDRQRLSNEFDNDDDSMSFNKNNPKAYLASV